MLSFQDAKWAKKMDEYMKQSTAPAAAKIKELTKIEPDFQRQQLSHHSKNYALRSEIVYGSAG